MLKTQELTESQLKHRAIARMVLNSFNSVFQFDEEKVKRNHGHDWATVEGFRNIFERHQKSDARARIQNAHDVAQELFLPHYDLVVPSFYTFVNEAKKQLAEITNLRMRFTNQLINALRPKLNEIDRSFQEEHLKLQQQMENELQSLRKKLQSEIQEKEKSLDDKTLKLDAEIQSLQGIFR